MTSPERRCRSLWQQIVVKRDGGCCWCGNPLASGHHALGRKNGVAFEHETGIALCVSCHALAHANPQYAKDMLRDKIGQERYDQLAWLSGQVVRLRAKDYREIADWLAETLAEIGGK
uniref:Uncharacterized protein n=1 Tax=viral metagenome TaxID=1070528 RepID=A0A6M3KIP8_9ZZZZ